MAEAATVTVNASQKILVNLTNHIDRHTTQYLLMEGSSKEFILDDSLSVQIGKTDLHMVEPEPL